MDANLLVVVMYYCTSTSFGVFTGDTPLLQRDAGETRPGVMQLYEFSCS